MNPPQDNAGNESVGRLMDALIEHQPDDPFFGDPRGWPAETDEGIASLGLPSCREQAWDDASGDELTDHDWDEYILFIERFAYESGCNMFFTERTHE